MPETRLLDTILQKKLGITGHIMQDQSNLSNTLITGMVFRKGKGDSKDRYSQDSIEVCGFGSFNEVTRMTEDRIGWRKLVKGATVNRTQPNHP